ncbi:MAG: NADH:flavin oxidoreductase [Candidatus Cloacimonetes bacterium]|nr:NADH:flavin oxidoreductase [Candidatus Cloacimonadota bacterium]
MNDFQENFTNKIFRSATFEGMADSNGFPTDEYRKYYKKLAENEVKNIITGFTYISQEGRAIHPRQAGIDSDEKIPYFQKITDCVHKFDSKIYLQIAHTGRQTSEQITKKKVVGVSNKKSNYFGSKPKQLSTNEIYSVIESFTNAAKRAKLAGFDGIQLHAAHGYLIHQFLHPYINNRNDEFGINNQTGIGDYFLRKTILSIRKKCGQEFPILIKISASDNLPKQFTINNFISLIKVLDELKISKIEISYGTMENALNIFRGKSIPYDVILKHNFHYKTNSILKKKLWKIFATPFLKHKAIPFSEMYNLKYAKIAKKITDIPIICVGGFRSGDEIKKAIISGNTDFVSLCRPFICEHDFVKKLAKNSSYISNCCDCNICAIMCDSKNSTRCYFTYQRKRIATD